MRTYRLNRFYAYLSVLCALLLGGCSTVPKKLADPLLHPYAKNDQQLMLVQQSLDLKSDFKKQGLIISKGPLNEYISSLGSKLLSASEPSQVPMQFHVLRSPSINAMAAPNGDIYVNLGLIAMTENEAQLAMVMCHEIIHVVNSHSFENAANRKESLIAAHVADLMLFGTGIAYIPFIANIASYSRTQETESDIEGMKCLDDSGYDVAEAAKVFQLMEAMKAKSINGGGIFSSHPELEDRSIRLEKEVAGYKNQSKVINTGSQFGTVRDMALDQTVKSWFRTKHFNMALQIIDQRASSEENNKLTFYQAEAFRGIAQYPSLAAKEQAFLSGTTLTEELKQKLADEADDNFKKSIEKYHNVLSQDKDYAEAYRGLGLIYNATGEKTLASQNLKQYLSLKPTAKDKRYVSHLIKLNKE